jgi:hypothetical protein
MLSIAHFAPVKEFGLACGYVAEPDRRLTPRELASVSLLLQQQNDVGFHVLQQTLAYLDAVFMAGIAP